MGYSMNDAIKLINDTISLVRALEIAEEAVEMVESIFSWECSDFGMGDNLKNLKNRLETLKGEVYGE